MNYLENGKVGDLVKRLLLFSFLNSKWVQKSMSSKGTQGRIKWKIALKQKY